MSETISIRKEAHCRLTKWTVATALGCLVVGTVIGAASGYQYAASQQLQPKRLEITVECPAGEPVYGGFLRYLNADNQDGGMWIDGSMVRQEPGSPNIGRIALTLPSNVIYYAPNVGCGHVPGTQNWEHADDTKQWVLVTDSNALFQCTDSPDTQGANGSRDGSCEVVPEPVTMP